MSSRSPWSTERTAPTDSLRSQHGQAVHNLIARVATVPPHPGERHTASVRGGPEPKPEVRICHRSACRRAHSAPLPTLSPGRAAIDHILAVGVDPNRSSSGKRLQNSDDRRELHFVVGGSRGPALRDFHSFRSDEHCAPSTGRVLLAVSGTSTVSIRHPGRAPTQLFRQSGLRHAICRTQQGCDFRMIGKGLKQVGHGRAPALKYRQVVGDNLSIARLAGC